MGKRRRPRSSGGVSITIRSYVDFACSSRLSIAWLSISSPGFGGSAAPATSTSSVRAPPSHRPDGGVQVDRLRRLAQRHRADQHIRHTRPRADIELLSDRRTPQIGLQQQHPRAHPRRRARQMTRDGRLPITRGSRGDQQRPQLAIDVEVAQMRADQMESLRLARRQGLLGVLLASSRNETAPRSRGRPRAAAGRRSPPGPSAP